jgi:hypothetical protein
VVEGWRELHDKELLNLLFARYNYNRVKEDEMGRACSTHVAQRNAYWISAGKPEGKTPLGRLRHTWEDNIKIDCRKIGWNGMAWIDLTHDRDLLRALVNTVMSLRVP